MKFILLILLSVQSSDSSMKKSWADITSDEEDSGFLGIAINHSAQAIKDRTKLESKTSGKRTSLNAEAKVFTPKEMLCKRCGTELLEKHSWWKWCSCGLEKPNHGKDIQGQHMAIL